MTAPRSIVPDSIMPGYPFLAETRLDTRNITQKLRALRMVGVPYTDAMIENAEADIVRQINPDAAGGAEFLKRYPKAQVRPFTGSTDSASELDALIAYMQMLGTLVDFAKYDESGPNLR